MLRRSLSAIAIRSDIERPGPIRVITITPAKPQVTAHVMEWIVRLGDSGQADDCQCGESDFAAQHEGGSSWHFT
jgi:hypothetical protein